MKFVTRAEALRRMRRGDLPTQGGGYSSALYFDDGARTTGPTGHKLHRDGLIERPAHTSVTSRYTLVTPAATPADLAAALKACTGAVSVTVHDGAVTATAPPTRRKSGGAR